MYFYFYTLYRLIEFYLQLVHPKLHETMNYSLLLLGAFQAIKSVRIGANYSKTEGTSNILMANLCIQEQIEREKSDPSNPNNFFVGKNNSLSFKHLSWLSNTLYLLTLPTILSIREVVERKMTELLFPYIGSKANMIPLSEFFVINLTSGRNNTISSSAFSTVNLTTVRNNTVFSLNAFSTVNLTTVRNNTVSLNAFTIDQPSVRDNTVSLNALAIDQPSDKVSTFLSMIYRCVEYSILLDQPWYMAVGTSFGLNMFGMYVEYYTYRYYNK